MLARVTAGKAGIVEYLVDGIKNGRDFTRDELDNRITLDGNLELTDTILNAVSQDNRDNYYHITLSFKENDLTNEKISDVYQEYKKTLLSAYDESEYNIYAEIHQPKIKYYEDKKTGEMIERLPHVHIVIPKKNLMSNKDFNPFGEYTRIVSYQQAIQEKINYDYNLSSPFDNQREMVSKADLISRYKGDNFNGKSKELKSSILDTIHHKDIKTWDDFKKEVSALGEVSESNSRQGKYLKLKLPNKKKNIRLKDSCFTENYINHRKYKNIRPTENEVNKKVSEWVLTKSQEMKHVHSASDKFRKQYYSANKINQSEILTNRIKDYEQRYAIKSRRSKTSFELGFKRNRAKSFAEIPNGLPSLSKRNVVNRVSRQRAGAESILSNNANNNMDNKRECKYNDVRWTRDQLRGRRGINNYTSFSDMPIGLSSLAYKTPLSKDALKDVHYFSINNDDRGSVLKQIAKDENEQIAVNDELELFREIRKELTPKELLNNLKEFNVNQSDYKSFKVKDGSYRINVGNQNLNVSDFLTKHMNLSWSETKEILLSSYQKQLENNLNNNEVNCIIYKPSNSMITEYTVYDSITTFNYLKKIELQKENDMSALDRLRALRKDEQNEIVPKYKTFSFEEFFKQQSQLNSQSSFKMNDLIATKDLKNKVVDYKHAETGKTVFTDKGDRIHFSDKQPSESAVLAGLKMAAEKFGTVELKGTKEFKLSLLEQAAKNDIKIIFNPKSLQQQYQEIKAQVNNNNELTRSENQPQEIQKSHNVQEQMTNNLKDNNQTVVIDTPKESQENLTNVVEQNVPDNSYDHEELSKNIDQPESKNISNEDQFDSLITQATQKMDKALKVEDFNMDLSSDLENEAILLAQQAEKVAFDSGLLAEKTNDPFKNEMLNRQFEKEMYDITGGTDDFDYPPFEQENHYIEKSQHTISYRWNKDENVFDVKFNDKPIVATEISKEFVEQLRQQDKFLANFSSADIMKGQLLPSKVTNGAEPRTLTVNELGEKVVQEQEQQAKQLKM
ncbi:hypothetical protein GLP30_17190 [Photobacterium phosphoreum]|uniref:Large polyvalent protein-associated domain-containing protein n=1 Tax=Photobacterium phosphoreum TaxID=659 RepID=A0AAW4ZY86_PHOPO|nr:LPD7 domain-containing protein [Photobacterium phosphoreum]MCD9492611.1 hypothetical protein [Photobacterium phosphoreum]MCF2191824.1 hypothetical protein [Photobacterium phosphoreum]MCF2303443.1 hypothetical protein [Photobacterium phosphoreum]